MIDLTSAPQAGRVLAYAADRLVYDGYELCGGEVVLRSGESLDLDGIYELHLFDAESELRAEFADGEWAYASLRADDEVDDDDHFTFAESQFVRERYWVDGPDERIVVNNHFSFNDGGFLRLEGYRLAMEA